MKPLALSTVFFFGGGGGVGLNGILKSITKSLTRFESIRFLGPRLILDWLKSPQNQGV